MVTSMGLAGAALSQAGALVGAGDGLEWAGVGDKSTEPIVSVACWAGAELAVGVSVAVSNSVSLVSAVW